MPAHPKAFASLAVRLAATADPATVDLLLDQWLDYRDYATEWDAGQWGFQPDRWCARERAELIRRARLHVGPPPMDHEGTTL